MLVDSHCHLDRLKLDAYGGDLDQAIDAARERGVDEMLCISVDRHNIPDIIAIAKAHEGIYASVGEHPCDIGEEPLTEEQLIAFADAEKVVAIGETGLDYHYSVERSEAQQESFRRHIRVANQLRKPVVVHTRNAREDTLKIIAEESDPAVAGVMHCFTEDWDMARQALDMGFYISLSGIVTFKNAEQLRDVGRRMPMDRLLVETDSPYLAPVPYRGKPNEPKYVREVAEYLAELRGIEFQEIARQTSENFHRLFSDCQG